MDGTRTVARLVAEFARITGKLAPDRVTRVVADLAANRMLEELPVDAFHPLQRIRRRPWPLRLGRGLLAAARGQRLVLARIDPLVTFLYKAGGRLLFTRVVAVALGLVALSGLAVFVWTWALGSQPVFLTRGSYAVGALVLLGLNVFALACHPQRSPPDNGSGSWYWSAALNGTEYNLPVLHLPQLIGLSLGLSPETMQFRRHMVPVDRVLERVGVA